jgi:hypothetical protein
MTNKIIIEYEVLGKEAGVIKDITTEQEPIYGQGEVAQTLIQAVMKEATEFLENTKCDDPNCLEHMLLRKVIAGIDKAHKEVEKRIKNHE